MNADLLLLEVYMHRCLQLAALGGGYVAPNPLVGAVIVANDRIIGEGYHRKYGQAHAEPNAIGNVTEKSLLSKSTLFVNLEPCSHYGKTPPCAELIVSSGIPRVVIGTLDPNPKVSGRGVKILQDAGVEVIVGILTNECNELNKRFFTFQRHKRPYILLKWAQTNDGFIDRIRINSNQQPLQISNRYSQQLTHKMRSENQAILVSTNTVVLDNPTLNVRFWSGKSPIRLTLDRTGRIPATHTIFDGNYPTVVFTHIEKKNTHNVQYKQLDFENKCIENLLNKLFEMQIHSVLVEGGAKLLSSFIEENYWDEAHVEVADMLVGVGIKAPKLPILPLSTEKLDDRVLYKFSNSNATQA